MKSLQTIVGRSFLFVLTLALAGLCISAGPATQPALKRTQPFILGAEVSWVPEDEAQGATYWDHGVKMDIFDILKKYKFNYIRLRLFVNPKAPGGYAARMSEPFCDLDHVIALSKRAKAVGIKTMIDIHLGDTWTSPGHQAKPAAWANLSFPDLLTALHDYTKSVTASLIAHDVRPEMIQVGNEISDGALLPDGSIKNYDNFAAILKAGIAGIREIDPTIEIALHHHLGRSNDVMVPWLDNLIQRGVNFDIIGMSCYNQAHDGDWKNNFDDLAKRYPDKQQLVLEYSGTKRYINDLMYQTPDNKGLGTFMWEPTRWREALLDKNGVNAGGGGAQPGNMADPIGGNTRPASAPATRPATRPFGRRSNGGRYDANSYFDLYPVMSKDYGNDNFGQ